MTKLVKDICVGDRVILQDKILTVDHIEIFRGTYAIYYDGGPLVSIAEGGAYFVMAETTPQIKG